MSATAVKTNGRARAPRAVASLPAVAGAQLAAAVLRVQAEAPKLIRNATGQVQSRTYGYVTNDAVVDAVLPLLVAEELLWRTFPTTHEDGSPALRYRMTHVPSGEYDEDVMKLACVLDPQGQGSGLTYARRYALVAYLNLTVDVDDDGAAASPPAVTSQPASQPTSTATAAEPAGSERHATAKQRNMLRAKAKAAKLTDGEFANTLKATWGDPAADWSDEAAAKRFLERALDRLPARFVDDAIVQINNAGSRS